MFLPLIHRGDRLRALVVGGGRIAHRKVEDLLAAGAWLRLLALEIRPELRELLVVNGLEFSLRRAKRADLEGINLLIVATDDTEANKELSAWARERGIPVNVVDQPDLCTVYFAGIVRRDPLLLAISTGGAAPFIARAMKGDLEQWVDEHWALRATWARHVREFATNNYADSGHKDRIYRTFMSVPDSLLREWDLENPPVELWGEWAKRGEEA